MVLRVGKTQNLQKVLSNFLSVFLDFGHIWRLLEIGRTFSKGPAKLLFFQSKIMIKRVTLTLDVIYEDSDRLRDKDRC